MKWELHNAWRTQWQLIKQGRQKCVFIILQTHFQSNKPPVPRSGVECINKMSFGIGREINHVCQMVAWLAAVSPCAYWGGVQKVQWDCSHKRAFTAIAKRMLCALKNDFFMWTYLCELTIFIFIDPCSLWVHSRALRLFFSWFFFFFLSSFLFSH